MYNAIFNYFLIIVIYIKSKTKLDLLLKKKNLDKKNTNKVLFVESKNLVFFVLNFRNLFVVAINIEINKKSILESFVIFNYKNIIKLLIQLLD